MKEHNFQVSHIYHYIQGMPSDELQKPFQHNNMLRQEFIKNKMPLRAIFHKQNANVFHGYLSMRTIRQSSLQRPGERTMTSNMYYRYQSPGKLTYETISANHRENFQVTTYQSQATFRGIFNRDILTGIAPILQTRQKMVEICDFLYKVLKPTHFIIVHCNTDNLILILAGNTLEDCVKPEMVDYFQDVKPTLFNIPTNHSGNSVPAEPGKLTLKFSLKKEEGWQFIVFSECNHVIHTQDAIKKRKLSGYPRHLDTDDLLEAARRLATTAASAASISGATAADCTPTPDSAPAFAASSSATSTRASANSNHVNNDAVDASDAAPAPATRELGEKGEESSSLPLSSSSIISTALTRENGMMTLAETTRLREYQNPLRHSRTPCTTCSTIAASIDASADGSTSDNIIIDSFPKELY